MSNTSQSLLNVFENMNESITMQYGDSTECGYKKNRSSADNNQ